jgi:hypothetical protein
LKKETLFKLKIQKKLKQIPGLWSVRVQMVALRGCPDLLMCFNGRFIAWELKTSVGAADALQTYTLNAIAKAGGTARVITPENVKDAFKEDFGCQDY